MQIAFVGLGKMGGNMVHRILRDSDDIEVVVTDHHQEAMDAGAEGGAAPATTLEELVQKLEKPRNIWLMIPSGAPTQETIQTLLGLLDEGDLIIDGGNSRWTDSAANGAAAEQHGLMCMDGGTSGGAWGAEGGHCRKHAGHGGAGHRG